MKKFIKHFGKVVPLDMSNIDTDVIIPKQFLKKITKNGFGKYLFFNWRYINNNIKDLNYKFILNNKIYKNSSILLTRKNFGCGSSREHAVWAIKDFGFKVIISASFSDIFYNNCFNNGILLITLNENKINEIFKIIYNNKKSIYFQVNIVKKYILIFNKKYFFKINPFYQFCLINGLDRIDYTMKYKDKIKEYENKNIFF
ncbi:3-isopropylmalate dehydratase small subunit (plasmid) [Buchnera aphidicola (Ceratoglyphina bambusae)]|uniref:3-isopropylmalate dehydratase small subunit n=1 Tax=Buchnera aphidicola TaxID=9 RepID=UPI0031B81957